MIRKHQKVTGATGSNADFSFYEKRRSIKSNGVKSITITKNARHHRN
ncbi:hypothetical protein [Pedobacter chitinilyticus]|nr:hypothetical protein [Pedobacter chitinilyticus]